MNIVKRIFDYKGTPILATAFLLFFLAERKRPLRTRRHPGLQREVTNAMVSIPAFSLLRFMFLPAMIRLANKSEKTQAGLNYQYKAHRLFKGTISFLLLDYSNYLWHILLHKIPLLWRFHIVHHTDRDLTVSTALRFHFGEMIGSLFYRGAWVFFVGVSPFNVLLYEIVFEGATAFHHSNQRLPFQTEKLLNKLIVTPRMHGIHHSVVRQETDSNYSVIFSFWDRLHNTIRLNVHQDLIVTGVPSYNDARELTIGYLLKMPFGKIRKAEQVRETGASMPGKNNLAG
jgi:sterol desaturase/sphingolipid hydroxylase (fatty acid hydroxylase superfamily)